MANVYELWFSLSSRYVFSFYDFAVNAFYFYLQTASIAAFITANSV